jgi:hypothetical protein
MKFHCAQGGSFFGLASSAKIILGFTVSGTERRLKLAFHDGGRDDFLGAIQGALGAKSWVVRCPQLSQSGPESTHSF